MPLICVLYTGGTFGMIPAEEGLIPRAHLRDEVVRLIVGFETPLEWTYEESARIIDSAELDPRGMGDLADGIRDRIAREKPAAVVVIHGTDTMAYSAAFVAFALADLEIPIVFTGSQRPLGMEHSDADANFEHAFRSATTLPAGVWIAFNGHIVPAVRATKRSSESPLAFVAHRRLVDRDTGIATGLRDALRQAVSRETPRIGLVKVSPGVDAQQLGQVLRDSPSGMVLECYGAGTAPVTAGALRAPIHAATRGGAVVLAITQCEHGAVDLGRYAVGAALAKAGVADGGDMTAEAALGKFAALARAGYSGAELRALLETDLIGERG